MFLGLFIVIAGVISLLESMGVIVSDVKWGLPLAVICIGLSLIYNSATSRQKTDPADKGAGV